MGFKFTIATTAKGGLDSLSKRMRLLRLRKAYVKAGVLGKKSTRAQGGITNPQLASVHEYGTSTVPARPFIGPAFQAGKAAYLQLVRSGYRAAVFSNEPNAFLRTLRLIGMRMVSDIRKYVTAGPPIPPPLAPATIARKGSSRPLVDTGQLIRAVDYEVVE